MSGSGDVSPVSIVEEVTARLKFLQSVYGHSADKALQILKHDYIACNHVVSGIQSFQFLLSKNLDRDQMLMVLKAIPGNQALENNIDPGNLGAMMKIDISESMEEDLKCRDCNRVFASWEALGRHTVSHSSRRKRKTDFDLFADYVHQCELCSMSFVTVEDLADHTKASHRRKTEEASTGKQEVKYPLDFDLNQTPPEYCSISSTNIHLVSV